MTELGKLSKRIKDKFKTINSFCRCNNLDAYDIQKLFACERAKPGGSIERTKRLIELSDLCKSSSPNQDPNRITTEMRSKISVKIDDLGGAYKFCSENEQFPLSSVYQIIQGRRKNMTPKTKELINFLGING